MSESDGLVRQFCPRWGTCEFAGGAAWASVMKNSRHGFGGKKKKLAQRRRRWRRDLHLNEKEEFFS